MVNLLIRLPSTLGLLLCHLAGADVLAADAPSPECTSNCTELLVERNADVDVICSQSGMRPLSAAVVSCRSTLVAQLLSNGANPNVIIAAVLEFIDSLALLLHWKYSSALLATSLVTLSYHHHATSIEMTDALVMRH